MVTNPTKRLRDISSGHWSADHAPKRQNVWSAPPAPPPRPNWPATSPNIPQSNTHTTPFHGPAAQRTIAPIVTPFQFDSICASWRDKIRDTSIVQHADDRLLDLASRIATEKQRAAERLETVMTENRQRLEALHKESHERILAVQNANSAALDALDNEGIEIMKETAFHAALQDPVFVTRFRESLTGEMGQIPGLQEFAPPTEVAPEFRVVSTMPPLPQKRPVGPPRNVPKDKKGEKIHPLLPNGPPPSTYRTAGPRWLGAGGSRLVIPPTGLVTLEEPSQVQRLTPHTRPLEEVDPISPTDSNVLNDGSKAPESATSTYSKNPFSSSTPAVHETRTNSQNGGSAPKQLNDVVQAAYSSPYSSTSTASAMKVTPITVLENEQKEGRTQSAESSKITYGPVVSNPSSVQMPTPPIQEPPTPSETQKGG
ncbi:hypothetical protein B0O99DRAFT_599407 [Bisporella sp. PMI_857]|nr:hypothetical protein B0O99DRAFT_599407 [Bisporella sp. PMI_857]